MKKPMFYVDFNEMLEPNLVLLSVGDTKIDSSGKVVSLHEGLEVCIYMDNTEDGKVDNLVAGGVVERNKFTANWGHNAKWCCRIDGQGIQFESEL